MATFPSAPDIWEDIRRGTEAVGGCGWFIRSEDLSKLAKQRTMTLTGGLNARKVIFAIRPNDIVAVKSYAENDP